MDNYEVKNNYIYFKDLGDDSIGSNKRVAEIKNRKPVAHKLLTQVHPFLYSSADTWKRIKILLEGIRKSNIVSLYSPEEIKRDQDKVYLTFPYRQYRNFEQVLKDAESKHIELNFDLAFSIVLSIADLIDTGSSIVVSGQKSFHGMLTPDNIFIDFDGKILLKNYGIHQYLKEEKIFIELTKKYGTWLTPEFLRKEPIVPQSDIFHLGYIIYRMLTGKYFSLSPGEDLNTKLSNISFTCHMPYTDKNFIDNIIAFLKKTLHPDPLKRFSNIREFKDYVSANFHIEELSSITFNLAYFMNSIYSQTIEEEEKILKQELAYEIPVPKKEVKAPIIQSTKDGKDLVEDILSGLDEGKKSRAKPLLILAFTAVILAIAIIIFLPKIISSSKQVQEKDQAIAEKDRKIAEAQKEIDKLKTQTNTTEQVATQNKEKLDMLTKQLEETRKAKEELEKEKLKIAKAKKQKAELEQKEQNYNKFVSDARTYIKKNDFENAQKSIDEAKKINDTDELKTLQNQWATSKEAYDKEQLRLKIEAEKKRKEQAEMDKPAKLGELVPLKYVTVKPVKISGDDPKIPSDIRKKNRGKSYNVVLDLLINEKGSVARLKTINKEVPGDLRYHIQLAIATWKYSPAKKKDVKVSVWIRFEQKFDF